MEITDEKERIRMRYQGIKVGILASVMLAILMQPVRVLATEGGKSMPLVQELVNERTRPPVRDAVDEKPLQPPVDEDAVPPVRDAEENASRAGAGDCIDPGEDVGFNGVPGKLEVYEAEQGGIMGSVLRRAIGRSKGWDAGGLGLSGTVYARTYNEGGDTLSDVFGFEKPYLLSWMHGQANTGYYLGTVYDGGDNRNPNGDANYNGRDVRPGQAGMNGTGFIWHMLMKGGARVTGESDGRNTSFVNNTAALQAAGANVDNSGTNPVLPGESGWVSFLASSHVEYKTYISDSWDDMVKVLVADDYWDAGDVIWTWDLKNPLVSGAGGNNGKFPNADTAQRLFFTDGMYGHDASGLSWGNSAHNHVLLYCGESFARYTDGAANNYAQYVSGVSDQLVWHSSETHFNYQTWAPDDSTPWNQITSIFPKESGGPFAVTIVKTGESVGKLKLKKISANQSWTNGNQSYSLAGSVYGVYRADVGTRSQAEPVATLVTDKNGDTNEVELDVGTYYVKEITAPKGYTLDVESHQVVVESSRTATVQSREIPQRLQIRLSKVDAQTGLAAPQNGATLAGAVYEVYDTAGSKVDELVTDAGGTAVSQELALGNYTVRETKAPKGYLLDGKTYTVNGSTPSDTTTQVFEYGVTSAEVPQKVRIRLNKVDAETGKGEPQGAATLAGAVYGIYDASGNRVDELTTDVNGTAVSQELALGNYTVRETKAPKGYLLDGKTYTVNGSTPSDTTTQVFEYGVTSAEVPQKVRIRLNKMDAETGKGEPQGAATLAGAVYEVYDTAGSKVDELVTDAGGTAVSRELPLGDYMVREAKAPTGYLVDGQSHVVKASNPRDVVTRVFEYEVESGEDVIRGNVEIVKLLENLETDDDTMEGLSGVEFTFTSKTTGETVLTIVTDENGFATTASSEQPRGMLLYDIYTVTETKYPEGVKPIEPFDVTITRERVTLKGIYKEDKWIVSPVMVVKRDAGTGKAIPIAGVEFRLLDENKEPVTMTTRYPNKEVHETFQTDGNGQFIFPDMLKRGTYYLEEQNAPQGYLKGELLEFTVEDGATWEHPLVVEFMDENAMGKIRVEKFGAKNRSEEKSDAKPNSGESGKVVTDEGVRGESAERQEIEAGKEGMTDEEPNGESADGETEDGEASDEEKADSDTEVPLDGAVFEITAAEDVVTPDGTVRALKGDVVDTITTAQGVAESKPLFLGTYMVKEITPPEGYVLSDEVYEVTLAYQDQDTAIVECVLKLENRPSRVELYKIDKETKEPLPGVEFAFWRKAESGENGNPGEAPKLEEGTESEKEEESKEEGNESEKGEETKEEGEPGERGGREGGGREEGGGGGCGGGVGDWVGGGV